MASPLLGPYASYLSAPAPVAPKVQVVQPTEPVSYVRLTWLIAAVVGWIILGTLLAKYQPAPKAPAATDAPPVGWPHIGRWPAPYQSDDTQSL